VPEEGQANIDLAAQEIGNDRPDHQSGDSMNRRRPAVLESPNFFSTLSALQNNHRSRTRSAITTQLLPTHRKNQSEPLQNDVLARLVRESFEAGYAAGAANAIQTEDPHDLAQEVSESAVDSSLNKMIAGLTPRRLEVLKLVARGLTNPEIATVLGISPNTVKAHLTGILETLDLTNRTEAAMALQDYEATNRSSQG
jgi:DNA-binding CsgD family transcriptional regulator